ncbi:hypothetical protein AB0L06_09580 [Spirillospora sp. NPDC052269]
MDRQRRWPAFALAVVFLAYAVGKAAYAMQARLGFPGGPPVSDAETHDYFLDPALAQWFATFTGILAAGVALTTVTSFGRRVPRPFMLLVLAAMAVAVLGGGGIMALDAFIGLGVGWNAYYGVLGIVMVALFAETTRSYLWSTRAV